MKPCRLSTLIALTWLSAPALAQQPAAATPPAPPPAATPAAPAAAPAPFDLTRPEIVAFVDAAAKEGLNRQQVLQLLGQAEAQPRIIDLITRPAERTLQWWEYRARFLGDERIDAGVALWRAQRELLAATAHRYQVSPQYLLAILGVETFYGRITGRYRVLDALATLAFDYPPRAPFFSSELLQFMRLVREEKIEATAALGSYAGAMGLGQFMPSSYRRYAVNGGAQPGRDLWTDMSDVFGSVANYLHEHGWQYGAPVLAEARFTGATPLTLPDGVALNDTVGGLRARGFQIDFGGGEDTAAVAVVANQADAPGHRVGFRNFFVITRYNRSPLYAMAVNDLAEAIAARYYGATP